MAERLPIRKYTTEDGLAHARVRRIVRDPRGFLWFCTVDGLSRFDGAEFVTYRTGDGLPDPWVTDVLATRDGAYWVATNAGVAIFDPFARAAGNDRPPSTDDRPRQFFTRVASEGSPAHRQVRVLLEDRAGRIWAGGQGGLSILDRSGSTLTFRPVVPGPAAMVTSLVDSADGGLWMGTLDGLFHRRPSGAVIPEPTAIARWRQARPGVGPGRRWPALGRPRRGLARARTWRGGITGRTIGAPPAHATAVRARPIADFGFRRKPTTRAS